jgi:hypothetical protein
LPSQHFSKQIRSEVPISINYTTDWINTRTAIKIE